MARTPRGGTERPAEQSTSAGRHGKPTFRTSEITNEAVRGLCRALDMGRPGQKDVTADAVIRACVQLGAANLPALREAVQVAENEIARERAAAASAPSGK